MNAIFANDRWKIQLDNGQIVGHFAAHCLYPVLLNNVLLYARGLANQWAIVARDLSNNQEQLVNIPGIAFPGITYTTDGRFCAFAFPQQYGKEYDPRNFLLIILDTQAKQVVDAPTPYVQEGVTYPKIGWLHSATSVGEYARHPAWNGGNVEYTTVELGPDSLAARYWKYTKPVIIQTGAIGTGSRVEVQWP